MNSIKNLYLDNIEQILRIGETITDERGETVREVRNLCCYIDLQQTQDEPVKGIIWNGKKLEDYQQQLLDPSDKGFVYDYGNRLRGFDVDQIENIIQKLNTNKNTRRAVAVTWRPTVDCAQSEVPCLILLDFKVRPQKVGNIKLNKLHCTAVFRSNDMYGAWYCNAMGIYNIMKYIIDNLDFKCFLGTLVTLSISAHIYETDIPQAEKVLELNNYDY